MSVNTYLNGQLVRVAGINEFMEGQIVQVDFMPEASSTYLDKIYQYVGTTTENYTNGYFYKCVSDGAVSPTYSWSRIDVQPSGGTVDQSLDGTSTNAVANAAVTNAIINVAPSFVYDSNTENLTYVAGTFPTANNS